MIDFDASKACANKLDQADELAKYRDAFCFPKTTDNKQSLYFCGHSLGLQPKQTRDYVNAELQAWADHGVNAHVQGAHPWVPYHEFVAEPLANLVGAKTHEVIAMNSLTTNLHLLCVSFYRPNSKRRKILIEARAFPSDRYAMLSQLAVHGFNADEDLLVLPTKADGFTVDHEQLFELIEQHGDEIALALLPGVQYLSGQVFDLANISKALKAKDIMLGVDLAHAIGNVELNLHEDAIDFAVWCSYKYLNSGPGAIGGAFIHEKHVNDPSIPRFNGWWGHDKASRFAMPDDFKPIASAEAWQLSNPPILQLAALRASLQIFDEIGLKNSREKSEKLTAYLAFLLKRELSDKLSIVTPLGEGQHGAQLSLLINKPAQGLEQQLSAQGLFCDFREPNIIRLAPIPSYNSFTDVYQAVHLLKEHLA